MDPAALWSPRLGDALNRVDDDVVEMEETHLYPDGTVDSVQHMLSTYSDTADLTAYPFDSHYVLATRRSIGFDDSMIVLNASYAGWVSEDLSPGNDIWVYGDMGSLVCSRASQQALSNANFSTFVFYLRIDRQPSFVLKVRRAPCSVP